MIKVIAEPAIYWHGDEDLLLETVKQAAVAQADFFKLQLFDTTRMGNPWKHKEEFYKQCEIGENLLNQVKKRCAELGMELICTVNHAHKVELCKRSNVSNVKIASGQIHPLFVNAIKEHKWERVFVSTGMVEDKKVLDFVHELKECTKELVLMHCVSLYPTHDAELNLNRIKRLTEYIISENCKVEVGYSDHHMDDLPCLVAVGLGATYLEKHFRVGDSFGPTCEIAVSPDELANLTALCKRMSKMLGSGGLSMQEREWQSFDKYKTRWVI